MACYDVPQPVCGFVCGTGGACPDDYTCNPSDNRCHLNGAPATTCLGGADAGIDTPDSIGVDMGSNTPPSVVSTNPTDGATGVAVTSTVSATFSEEVFGLNGSTFSLSQGAQLVAATVSYMSAANPVATLTPTAQLLPNTTYTATLMTSIVDSGGAALPQKTWTFTTAADTTAPTVTNRTPAPNATNVALSSTVTAQFSENVIGVSGTTFTLADGVTPITGTVSYVSANRTATFTPSAALPPGRTLTATLTAGITDTSSNALSGAPVTWTFMTAADTTAPTVMTRVPGPGATMVANTATIVVTFDEPVMNVTATTFTVNDGAAVTGTFAQAMSGRQWTFTPSAALASNAAVTVTLTTGITDLAGNALAAPVTWMFMTAPDTTAPTVMTRTPAPNATMVSTTSTIVVTFSEPVMGVTTSSFTVNDGAAVTGTLASAMGGRQWTFTPSAAYANNATVTVTLTTGIADLAGNALAAPVTWTFTTVPDLNPPMVTARTPIPGDNMAATDMLVTATFNEPVMNVTSSTFTVSDGSALSGTLTSSNGGRVWTFTPALPYPGTTVITATLTTGITDLAGNALAAPVTWTFTTVADAAAPTVTAQSPAPGATSVGLNTSISATFSEPVIGVSATSFTVNDGSPVTGTLVSSNGSRTWTFIPSAPLNGGSTTTVTLSTAIGDTSGNMLAAPVTWTFGVFFGAGDVPPFIQSTAPLHGTINVPRTTTIAVTFNEPVMNVTTSNFTVTAGGAVAGTLASSNGGRIWTFTPNTLLPAGTGVFFTIGAGITDSFGLPLSGTPATFMFTTP